MDSDSDEDDAYQGTRPQKQKPSLPRVSGAAPALPKGVRESHSGGPINNRRRTREAKPPSNVQTKEQFRLPMATATLEPLAARALPVQSHPRESAAMAAKQVGSQLVLQLVLEDHFPPPSVGQSLPGRSRHGSRGGLGSPLRPGVYPPQLQAALERSLAPQPGNLMLNDPRGGAAGGGPGKGVGRVAWTPVARQRLPSLIGEAPNGSSSTDSGSSQSGSRSNKNSSSKNNSSSSGFTESRNPMTEALFARLQDDDDSDGSDWGDEDDDTKVPGAKGRFFENESMPLKKPKKRNSKAVRQPAQAHEEAMPVRSAGRENDFNESHGKGALYRGGPVTPASAKPNRSPSSSGRGGIPADAQSPSRRGSQRSRNGVSGNGSGSSAAAATTASGQTPMLPTPSERVCIEAFGVSYFELVTKLAMEEGVLSDAESRLVLLLLSEPSNGPGASLAERMLTAVVTIEKKGITKAAVRVFRQELNSIASEVAKKPELVQILADRKVFLGRRASSRALMGSASGSRPNSHSRSKRDLLGSPGGSARRKAAANAGSTTASGGSGGGGRSSPSSRNSLPLGSVRGSFDGGTGSSSSNNGVHNHLQHPGALSHAGARTLGAVLASQAMLHHHHALTNPNHQSFPGSAPPLSPNSALKSLQESEPSLSQEGNTTGSVATARRMEQFRPGKQSSRSSQRIGSSHRAGSLLPSVGGQPPTPSSSSSANKPGLGQPAALSPDAEPVTGPLPGAPPSHLTALFQRVPAIAQVMGKIAARIAELPAEYASSPQKQQPPSAQPSIREKGTSTASGANVQLLPPLSSNGDAGNGGDVSSGATATREQVILVASGAFNPVHKMHLRHLYIARKYLEERTEFEVLGGLISPQHATTVRGRYRQMRSHIIPPKHRLAMARAAVGASTWLTVDPWEITRRRVMDYLSVLDHVAQLADACFPGLPLKVLLLANPKTLMQLSPEYLRARGYGCLCVCRPQETDRLLRDMGSRWRQVAFVVEDAAILSRDLEATTSARLREALAQAASAATEPKHPNHKRSNKNGSSSIGQSEEVESSEKDFLAKAEAMSGFPVAKYAAKHRLGAKLAGTVRWGAADTEFELYSGLADEDMGYETEAAWRQGRHQEQRENGGGGVGPGAGAASRDSVNGADGFGEGKGQGSEKKSKMNRAKHQHRFSTL